jgi:hypothetical protein
MITMGRTRTNSSQLAVKKSIKKMVLTTFLSHLAFSGAASAITMVDQAQSPYTLSSINLVIYSNAPVAGAERLNLNFTASLNSTMKTANNSTSIILGTATQKILNTINATPDGSVRMDVSFNYVDKNQKSVGSLSCDFTLGSALLKTLNQKNFDKLDSARVTLTQKSTPTTCPIEIP